MALTQKQEKLGYHIAVLILVITLLGGNGIALATCKSIDKDEMVTCTGVWAGLNILIVIVSCVMIHRYRCKAGFMCSGIEKFPATVPDPALP